MQNGQGYKVQYYRRQFPHSFVVSVLLWPGWDFARLSGCAFPSPCHGLSLQPSPCQRTVGIVLAFQAVHSHPPATGYLTTLSQYAQQVVLFIFIPSAYKSKLLTLPDKNKAGLCPAYCFCCDPVGIRTQDPQLRR